MSAFVSRAVAAACFASLVCLLLVGRGTGQSESNEWRPVEVPAVWKKAPAGQAGYAWYRTAVILPRHWADRQVVLFSEPVDDAREVYINGQQVGGSGSFPPQFRSGLGDRDRHDVPSDVLRFGEPNEVAIRVYNSAGREGFNVAPPVLFAGDDAIRLQGTWTFRAGDDPQWERPAQVNPFDKVEATAHVERTLRQLPGEEGPLSVDEALTRFTVADDLLIEPVLSEPEIGQPLDFKFDGRGRLWVMNYKQYPNPAGLTAISRDKHLRTVYDKVPAPPPHHDRGRDEITIHEDRDGDGQFDHHKSFVGELNIATSFAIGRGGVFVLNPPYLLFYADRDQNDQPDGDPEVLLEGFGIEDSHSVVSNLRWGPDGWLYGAQGSTVTGHVKRYGSDEKPVHSMGQLIWRYHPERRQYEIFAEGGGNTFGVEIDSKGRIFSGHNGGDTRGFHYVQGGYYRKGFGKHGELSNPYTFGYFEHIQHHSVPRFTHTFIIYEGAALSAQYAGKLFGVGPLQSHVLCSDVQPRGGTFVTKDIGAVLTSSDPWFRPVQIHAGPDGGIYVADFYEQRIDHASHYQGRVTPDTGRIYRLRDPEASPAAAVRYDSMSSAELVAALRHENKWHRQEVQRILADRRDSSVHGMLRTMLGESAGQAALEALWALYTSGGFDEPLALQTLRHADPHVRTWCVRLACDEGRVSPQFAAELRAMALNEPHIEVRNQLACSVRRLPAAEGLPVLAQLMHRADQDDPFQPLLLWWALEAKAASDREQVLGLFEDDAFWDLPLVQQHMIQRLMRRYAQAGSQQDLLSCARLLDLAPSSAHAQTLLAGFEEAYAGRPLTGLPDELLAAMARVGGGSLTLRLRRVDEAALAEAVRIIQDPQRPAGQRAELIQILGQIHQPQIVPVLIEVLRGERDHQVRSAIFAALQAYTEPKIAEHVLGVYPQLTQDLQATAQSLLASRRSWGLALLDAVEKKQVPADSINAAVLQKLLFHDDPQLAQRVQRLWPDLQDPTADQLRAEVSRIQQLILTGSGNPYSGKQLFDQHCGKCHRLFSEGGAIGPDLTSYKRDDLQGVLLNVVNPSLEIREGFENFVVFMADGRTLNGFVEDQDNRVVVLKTPDGQTLILRRDEIDDMQAIRRSIMPDGLLTNLTSQQIRDLFAYLRASQPLP